MTRKIAVTGSASGIGRALAASLRARGDEVIGVDLKDADVCADLSTPDGRALAVQSVLNRADGALDGVVACAGVSGVTVSTVTVNFFGVTAILEGLRPALARAERPRAAAVASIAATQPADPGVVRACLDGDEPRAVALAGEAVERGEGRLLYPSSKSALVRWLRARAVSPEWAGCGIPLNAVAPGVVLTPMSAPLFEDETMRKIMDRAVPMPLNGYAEPEVVADALRWLVSPENSHMAGQIIFVDGGAEATLRGSEVY
ncbi:SDR family oxidoreductase [Microbispora sp. KK1-11]|uniref:SDR family oxidoreductase n=1 Tax=Microbispora sp. KK1-11 TaxID=2053005 RepID=UPI0011590152|nr:SDR family oxidoreductase [Microbispora sp. KK1-11]TQS25002.1 SDR family oxidoreductase [Microbispora sp. KK1-11]